MTSSTPSIFMDPEDTFRVESTVGMQGELMLRVGDPTARWCAAAYWCTLAGLCVSLVALCAMGR